MNANWTDFNDADSQSSYDLIPKGTIAPVRMTIKPGGHDDPNRGWTGGYATYKPETGSVYLNCEFVITQGPFARRKVWSLIGLLSQKGPEWGNMGRSFIRAILNSSRGISEKDNSPQAASARRIHGLADLDGIEFLAKIDVEKDQNDEDKNVIKFAITPDHHLAGKPNGTAAGGPAGVSAMDGANHKEYRNHSMGGAIGGPGGAPAAPPAPANQGGWQQPAQQPPQQGWQQPPQQPPQQQQPTQALAQGVPPRPQWAQ